MSERPRAEDIEQAAADWIILQQSGEWTEGDQREFDAWVVANIAHRLAYVRLETMWSEAGRLQAIAAGVPAGTFPARGAWGARSGGTSSLLSQPKPSVELQQAANDTVSQSGAGRDFGNLAKTHRRYWSIAAVITLAAVSLWSFSSSSFFEHDRYVTRVGHIEQVSLKDGSNITLNTDTRIRVAYEDRERRIALDRGEAFFQVGKDPARPFVVTVGDKRVIAVGTQFSVRRRDDDIRVAVAEGKVRVEAATDPGVSGTTRGALLLSAGSLAQTKASEVMVKDRAAQEVEQVLSWRSGYVAFRDTALADAVAEFNRYNNRKIVIVDPSIAAIRVGGKFKATNTQAFLWMLKDGFPIDADETGSTVVLRAQ